MTQRNPSAAEAATKFDLTLIATVHDETLVSGPTMQSAEDAVAAAVADGYSVEQILVFDNATDETIAYFDNPKFDAWTKMSTDVGDLGLARNQAIDVANGELVACLDGDDLFSENWLADGIAACYMSEAPVIAHPELNWIFDNANSIFAKIPSDDPLFTPLYFYTGNYYDSMLIAPRSVHLECPFGPREIKRGLAYQDWRFAIETMARGYAHIVVPDTIIFKRRRPGSLVTESHARKALIHGLDEMSIDRVRSLGS